MKLKISSIIPVYNRVEDMKLAVGSVLAQTLPVSEVIIIDDGSTDNAPVELPRMIAENPAWRDRVRYFRQENGGVSSALNHGISKVTGDWIAFCASDDLWLPQKLEWQFKTLEKQNYEPGLCFTDAWFMNNPKMKGTLFQLAGTNYERASGPVDDLPTFLQHLDQAWVQTVAARTDLIRQIGGFDVNLQYQEDQDFLFRMALVTKFCYVNMPMALIDRAPFELRHTGRSIEWHKEEFRLRMVEYRLEKNLRLSAGFGQNIEQHLRKSLRQIHSSWANLYLQRGEYEKARDAISKANKYDQTLSLLLKRFMARVAPKLMGDILTKNDKRAAPRYDQLGWLADETKNSK